MLFLLQRTFLMQPARAEGLELMTINTTLRTFLVPILLAAAAAGAQEDLRATLFEQADAAREAAREVGADLLAPDAFGRGVEAYADAEEDLGRGRNMERIRGELADAVAAFTQAAEAAEIARITLAPLIKTRDDAASASADTFAGEMWVEAEETFTNAMRRLESGDIRGARSRAEEAEALYRDAELTAIKAQYLSQTRALIAQAEQARVPRYAPKTFAKAEELMLQAEKELNENRYDTDLPRSLAQQANYEARHAIYLAERIRTIRDEDWELEDIILAYEDPLVQVAAAADKLPRLDQGTAQVAEELVAYIEELRENERQAQLDLEASRTRVSELEEEIRDLDERLGGVSQERVALMQRVEAEERLRERFASIESLFTRDEARISREGDQVVLRLVGLTFAVGSDDVDGSYAGLLDKVRQAINVFPNSQVIVEGHTDSYGSDEANMALSRQRAESVSAYLSTQLGVPAFRISAAGYGETRPIANNETSQGRERNRRIDIRIEPQMQ
ncbi:MAG: OmpA family protein [Gammaproteobacteria bacterium]|nr:OmpA family protein [Gammaproteobacteria bacterium]